MPLPVLQESRGPMPTRASQGPPGEDLGFFGTIGASFEAVAADSTMATGPLPAFLGAGAESSAI